MRYRLLHVADRIVRHARRRILRLQGTWPWAAELARARSPGYGPSRYAADRPPQPQPCPTHPASAGPARPVHPSGHNADPALQARHPTPHPNLLTSESTAEQLHAWSSATLHNPEHTHEN
jgi:hypothetical protein